MKRKNLIRIIIFSLVIINCVTLYFLYDSMQHQGPPHGPRKSLVEILNLKDAAASEVKKLETEHFKIKDSLVHLGRDLHQKLYEAFFHEKEDKTEIETLIDRIVENQRETEQMTFDYFKEVTKHCNEKQKKELRKVLHHALSGPRMPPPPHRR